MGRTRLLNRDLSRPSKPTHHLVSFAALETIDLVIGNRTNLVFFLGLQTPRLKRLAEIVSAQAIAQQEKLEYSNGDDGYDTRETLAEVHEVEPEE